MWVWGRNVHMWLNAQARDCVIYMKHSDHEEMGLEKWSLQPEKVCSGRNVTAADQKQQNSEWWTGHRNQCLYLWCHKHSSEGLGSRYLKNIFISSCWLVSCFLLGASVLKTGGCVCVWEKITLSVNLTRILLFWVPKCWWLLAMTKKLVATN